MDDVALLKARLDLHELNAAFTYFLDHNRIEELVGLFTEDALYTHGARQSQGRAAIRELFTARAQAGERTCRHLSSGLMLQIGDEGSARGTSVVLTFACDGPPPVVPATPYLVADFEDVYRLCPDGKWRIAVRHIHRIFVAEGNPGPVGGQARST
jgi:hypothetical protein